MICTLANSLWLAGCAAELLRFRRAVRHVAEEQEAILHRILSENADTEFGTEHGFSSIRSVAEYQSRVPLRNYDLYEPWITQTAGGARKTLTRERVRLFEPTSGSSGATKLIPYTAALEREFQRGIRAWIADLYTNCPELIGGQAYWSVSPRSVDLKTSGGIPIGFEDDTSYVGGWQKRLVNAVMAVPASIRQISDIDAFWYRTLLFLARSRNLRLVSVWNPTYFSLLLDRLDEVDVERLCNDLSDQRCSREVRAALCARSPEERYARLWPRLKVISCWSDANAAGPAARLAELFPQCRMQGKGLIATEAFVSFPLMNQEHAALAIRSHFLEFVPAGGGVSLLAHQLDRGAQYTVAVTTGGGLYRYELGDLVEVTGHLQGCPLVRFVGRQGYVSDWFGEKLNEAHVSNVLREVFTALRMAPSFSMLACDTGTPPGYVLYVESPEEFSRIHLAAERIDAGLRTNFHYNYARELGQLACVRPFRVLNGARAYLNESLRNGQKAGDVKGCALDRRTGWSGIFREVTQDKCPDSVPHTSF